MISSNSHLKALLIIAAIMTFIGIVLIVSAFLVPPLGVIDNTVLVAYGETLTFVGALVGVDYTYRYKIQTRKHAN